MLVALAFIVGLALGFPIGVAAYFGTFALFMRWQEEKYRQRLARAQQEAARRAQQLEKLRAEMRQRYADRDASDEQVNEEVEKILGTGPSGRDR